MNLATDLRPLLGGPTVWEKVASTRWGSYVTEVERKLIMRAQTLAGPPDQALEVGCEGGRWSKMLADLGWNLTCIDVNQPMLALCKARLPAAQCILTKPEDAAIPCPTGSQALLLCIEVAPVINSDWFVKEAARILKEDGILVGVTWNRRSPRGCFVGLKARLKGMADPFYRKSYGPFRRELEQNGLHLIHEEGFCWGPFGRDSNSSLVGWATSAEKLLCLDRMPGISPWVGFIAQKRTP